MSSFPTKLVAARTTGREAQGLIDAELERFDPVVAETEGVINATAASSEALRNASVAYKAAFAHDAWQVQRAEALEAAAAEAAAALGGFRDLEAGMRFYGELQGESQRLAQRIASFLSERKGERDALLAGLAGGGLGGLVLGNEGGVLSPTPTSPPFVRIRGQESHLVKEQVGRHEEYREPNDHVPEHVEELTPHLVNLLPGTVCDQVRHLDLLEAGRALVAFAHHRPSSNALVVEDMAARQRDDPLGNPPLPRKAAKPSLR